MAAPRRRSPCQGGAGLGECKAAPLLVVPREAGKGPTLEWTFLLPAGCGSRQPAAGAPLAIGRAGLGEGNASPLRAVPGAAGKGPTLVWTGPQPAGCGSRQPAAGAPLAVGGAGLGESKAALLRAGPERRARVPLSSGPARGLQDADQDSRRQERRSQCQGAGGVGLGECKAAALRVVPGAAGKPGKGLTLEWTCLRPARCRS